MVQPAELHGKRVLIIAVRKDDPETVQILAGTAQLSGQQLLVRRLPTDPPTVVDALDVIEGSFDPSGLPAFIAPMASKEILQEAAEVDWCIPIVAAGSLPGSVTIPTPFYAVLIEEERRVLLLRPSDGEPSPWANRTQGSWSSDEQAPDDHSWTDDPEDTSEPQTESARGDCVEFLVRPASDRELFWLELRNQQFAVYDAGLFDPEPTGTKGWITLDRDAPPELMTRVAAWLQHHPDVQKVTVHRVGDVE